MNSLTNFPNGVASFGIPMLPPTTGKMWFVCSLGGASGAAISGSGIGEAPDQPFLTIATALSRARANKGDIIIGMPGHAESVTAADGLALNKAGVAIIGLGWGNMRPTITMATSTAATIAISAANVTLRNFRITSSIDELVTVFNITAAHATLDAVDFAEGAGQARSFCVTTAAADDLTIQNCKHNQATAPAAAAAWIGLVGTDRARIADNEITITQANSATAFIIQSLTTPPVGIQITGNKILQLGGTTIAAAISLVAGTSGRVDNNRISSTALTLAGVNAIADCYAAENYVSNTVNLQGILVPGIDS